MKKKIFTLLLAIVASVGFVFAESGSCGDNLTWNLTGGVLTISGTGAMNDYNSGTSVPWYTYRSSITSAIVENGVTSIGDNAFYQCVDLTSVTIPNSVTVIGYLAFYECSSLTSVTIPNSVTGHWKWCFL
ncbi:MAG: leucine-rich repeat domain-containing protein [Paludibacteraceae bacterium]|nr:leucine-rich repeat domain-containing protein [Paludibacteraceae bacterium]